MIPSQSNEDDAAASIIEDEFGFFILDSQWPIEPPPQRSAEFHRLALEWKEATGGLPRVIDKFRHPAYRTIVNWGWDAVPFILSEIKNGSGGHWCEALREITGANPVPLDQRGNLSEMSEAWIRWGRNLDLIA